MTSMHDADSNARDDVPDDPTDLSGGSWLAGRAVAAGHPIEQEPFSELRDDRKLRKKEKKNLLRR